MKRNKVNVFLILMGLVFMVSGCAKTDSTDPTNNNAVKTEGALSVSTLTSTAGGSYSPKNVVAIWLENNSGTFVKSLLVFADTRKNDLTNWTTISSGNTTDAIIGATQTSYASRTCSWNGTNVSGTVVDDGIYRLCMELTDNNGTGNFHYFTFTKGKTADTQTPANVTSFSNISIVWTPK